MNDGGYEAIQLCVFRMNVVRSRSPKRHRHRTRNSLAGSFKVEQPLSAKGLALI